MSYGVAAIIQGDELRLKKLNGKPKNFKLHENGSIEVSIRFLEQS